MRSIVVMTVLWCGLAAPALSRDIFVNNLAGDDLYEGVAPQVQGARGGPCQTIAKALRIAEKTDRIIIANTGEPYRESVTLQAGRHSGVPGQPFVIQGNGAVLDGQQLVPPDVWQHVRDETFRFRPNRMTFQMLFLEDKPAPRRDLPPGERVLPVLKPLEWCMLDRHIYFRAGPGKLPSDHLVTHTVLPVGITLYEVRHVVIEDLVVQGFQLDGVNAHDSVFDTTLVGLTCRGNGRSGVSVGGASRVRLEACLVGNNGNAQLRTEGRSITRVVNCNLLENTAPAIRREGGEVLVEPAARAARTPNELPAATGAEAVRR